MNQYRDQLNDTRIAKGIPIIPANWIPRLDRSVAAWDNPNSARSSKDAIHQYKFLTFSDSFTQSGELLSETDHYQTGKTWQDSAEGTQVEYIRITYSYEAERKGEYPWRTEVLRQETGIIPQNVSLEEAVELLLSWGVTFP